MSETGSSSETFKTATVILIVIGVLVAINYAPHAWDAVHNYLWGEREGVTNIADYGGPHCQDHFLPAIG